MFENIIDSFLPELVTIEAKTQLILKKSGGFTLNANNPLKKSGRRLWMPALCLAAAKTSKEINAKVLQLAAILHIFNYASYLHFNLPHEVKIVDLKDEVQYPVLVGDMLYSQVCADLCGYGLEQYLDTITSLIASLHKELLQRDLAAKNAFENLLTFNAIISESACFMGSHAVAGNSYLTGILSSLGYNLGLLYAAYEMNLNSAQYREYWHKAQSLMEMLPPGTGKNLFGDILQNMESRWGKEKSILLKEKKA